MKNCSQFFYLRWIINFSFLFRRETKKNFFAKNSVANCDEWFGVGSEIHFMDRDYPLKNILLNEERMIDYLDDGILVQEKCLRSQLHRTNFHLNFNVFVCLSRILLCNKLRKMIWNEKKQKNEYNFFAIKQKNINNSTSKQKKSIKKLFFS